MNPIERETSVWMWKRPKPLAFCRGGAVLGVGPRPVHLLGLSPRASRAQSRPCLDARLRSTALCA
eukprot:4074122-Pyramimonas_sp.AAC.1